MNHTTTAFAAALRLIHAQAPCEVTGCPVCADNALRARREGVEPIATLRARLDRIRQAVSHG